MHPKDTLRCWEEENREQDEDEELLNPDIEEMEEKNWQAWARLRPNNNIPIYGVDDLGLRPIDDGWEIEASRANWNDINLLMSSWIDEQKKEAQERLLSTLLLLAILENYVNAYKKILGC